MDKILDWLKGIGKKILDFWNKYTAKQKTIIITVILAIFLAIVLLVYFMTRPVYVQLAKLEDQKAASTLVESLESSSIPYTTETVNKYTIVKVDQNYFSKATMLIGANDLLSEGMTYSQALDNDMTTSAEEKALKTTLALQTSIQQGLKKFEGVEDATVYIERPEDDGTIYSQDKSTSVSVSLKMKEDTSMSKDSAKSIAYFLANAVGNKSTDSIVITDTKRNLLFGSKDGDSLGGSVSDTSDFKKKLSNQISENVGTVLRKYGYDDVEIGDSNIVFNMDKVTELKEEYSVPEGRDEGVKDNDYTYKSTGTSGSGGVPGTDSNGDETDYLTGNANSTNSETTLTKNKYLPNKTVQNIEKEVGAVNTADSTMGIVVTKYNIVKEENLKEEGKLNDMTFDEYIQKNNTRTPLTIDPQVAQLVASTTGINTSKITITGFQQPIFQAKQSSGINVSNYLMIILAVLIAALLVFVIIKGTSPVQVTEMEPELSVEDLLATTQEQTPLEDIEMGDKSETRKMIEKFVEENPEAVALLLRNWINEDWG